MKIGEAQLKSDQDADMRDAADRDIYIVQESGKMFVKDLETEQAEKDIRLQKRRTEGYEVDEDTDSDDDKGSSAVTKGQSAQ